MCCACTFAEVSILFHLVTILFVNEEMCPGDNLTFSCQGAGGALVWTLTNLPGVTGVMDYFGRNLNMDPGAERITSTDTQSGSSPSTITILNAAVADNGAMVQCSTVPNGASAMITLSIRELTNIIASYCVTMLSKRTEEFTPDNGSQPGNSSQGLLGLPKLVWLTLIHSFMIIKPLTSRMCSKHL